MLLPGVTWLLADANKGYQPVTQAHAPLHVRFQAAQGKAQLGLDQISPRITKEALADLNCLAHYIKSPFQGLKFRQGRVRQHGVTAAIGKLHQRHGVIQQGIPAVGQVFEHAVLPGKAFPGWGGCWQLTRFSRV